MSTENIPSLNGNSLPQVSVETRFNQGYRVASPVNAGGEIAAVCNNAGNVELFTTGTDGAIWNFYPDPDSDTGYTGVATPLKGQSCEANVDANGNIVVFANVGLQLFYIVEQPNSAKRWSDPIPVTVPQPKNPMVISKVYSTVVQGHLYLAVLTQYHSVISPTYALAWSEWDANNPSFQSANITFNSLHCVWTGNTSASLAFTCADSNVTGYSIATGQVTDLPLSANFSSVDVAAVTDTDGNNQLFAILNDGNLYHLILSTNQQQYTWQQLAEGYSFRQVSAALDGQGNINLLAVGGNSRLYHLLTEANSNTGYSFPPAPIRTGVATIGLATNDHGNLDIFSIELGTNQLHHLYLEETSGNWGSQQIEVPTGGQLEEYISYSSDITAFDSNGLVLGMAPVSVWAAEATWVTLNGAVYYIDASRPAHTTTNTSGILSLYQETNGLSVPSLEINYSSVMTPSQFITIDQYAGIQAKLGATSGTDLMQAKDQAGNYIIPDQYRNTEVTDSMASAINNCMDLAKSRSAHLSVYPNKLHSTQPGVWYRSSGSRRDALTITPPAQAQHWQLSFINGKVAYKDYSAVEMTALLADKRAAIPSIRSLGGFWDWIDDIGDVIEGVVEGIVNIVDVVVTTVGNAINAVITLVVDGVQYLFDAVVTFVEQAFDVVTAIFSQVKVFFEKVWEWIGFLFAWGDILRTHEAIAYTLNQFIDFTEGAVTGMQTIVDNGFNSFQQKISDLFQDAITRIAGNDSLGAYNNDNKKSSPQFTSASANNIVYSAIANNAGAISSSGPGLSEETAATIQQLYQQLCNFADFTESQQAFSNAATYFNNLGGDTSQIFSQLLAALLSVVEGVIQAIISGVQAVVDALFQIARTLIAVLQDMLNETWDIPIISDLYSYITNGAPFTAIDVMSLLLAIPITAMYKIVYDQAPFADAAAVASFKGGFNSGKMLQAAGFASAEKGADASVAASGGLMPQYATFFNIAGGLATFFFGCFTAINDAFPKEAPEGLSKVCWGLEAVAQAAFFPWWASSGAPSCDVTNSDGCAKTLWLFTNVGIIMDAVFIKLEGRLPENTNDAGVVIQFLYGSLGHLTFAIMASEFAAPAAVANYIIPVIPELCKLLRLSGVVEITRKVSLGVLAVVDVAFYTTSAILGAVAPTGSDQQKAQPAILLA